MSFYNIFAFKYSAFLVLLVLVFNAEAKRFSNQYCEFELPLGWECALEGSEYVCQSTNQNRQKEAIIILAAKKRGSQDSLNQYMAYLKNTKTFNLPGGRTQVSEPKYAKNNTLNDQQWVDALHLASEVPGFYTRYLATVKADLGIAITFSVAKDNYDDYKDVFDKVIESLKVFRQTNTNTTDLVLKKKDDNLLDSTYIPSDSDRIDIGQRQKKGGASGLAKAGDKLFYIVLLAGVIIFILIKKRKKKK
jgi:hypothetical protein